MVLQFDEVDALMSKRGEVKEARDRYANMEVSYLLRRIEDHCGPCILTTNMRNQIDKAFTRRFQVVVEFPRPDEAARAKLWASMMPPRAPLAAEVDVDFLAAAVNLTGGNIRNAA
jgi:SpoVK/Ycf46/Vps4 family AAA+-type ATPase